MDIPHLIIAYHFRTLLSVVGMIRIDFPVSGISYKIPACHEGGAHHQHNKASK
jgi:hypothetical protein